MPSAPELAPLALAAARAELSRLHALAADAELHVSLPLAPPHVATPAPAPPQTTAPVAPVDAGGLPLTETERARLVRVEATVRECSEVNERVMAQNIALLADLEAAQRTVRELRAGKDALAVQLRRALTAAAATAAAVAQRSGSTENGSSDGSSPR